MPPDAHTIPHHALHHTDIVRPRRNIVRYPHQRFLAWSPIRGHRHARRVIRYLLAGPLQQLRVHGGRQRPWRTA